MGSHASGARTRCAGRPTTTTGSTSQSTVVPRSSTTPSGPVRQEGNFVNTTSEAGATNPASSACGT